MSDLANDPGVTSAPESEPAPAATEPTAEVSSELAATEGPTASAPIESATEPVIAPTTEDPAAPSSDSPDAAPSESPAASATPSTDSSSETTSGDEASPPAPEPSPEEASTEPPEPEAPRADLEDGTAPADSTDAVAARDEPPADWPTGSPVAAVAPEKPEVVRGPSGDPLTPEQIAAHAERWAGHVSGPTQLFEEDGVTPIVPWSERAPELHTAEHELKRLEDFLETVGLRAENESVVDWAVRLLSPGPHPGI